MSLCHRDEILMMSEIIYTITHYTGLMVNQDIKLLGSHDFTKLLYCIISQT